MDLKKAGLVVLAVAALGALVWSFRTSFAGGAPTAGAKEAAQMKQRMEQQRQSASQTPMIRGNSSGQPDPNAPVGRGRPISPPGPGR
jgi:hypothetical protein